MTLEPDSSEKLAHTIRRVADDAESEMDLQVKVEKLLDPFLPKIPGATLDRYGHATKLGGIKDALHGNLIIELCSSWRIIPKVRKKRSNNSWYVWKAHSCTHFFEGEMFPDGT